MQPANFDGMTRRRFLQASAASLGLASLNADLKAIEPRGDFGGFTVGVQSYCFRNFDTEGALKRTRELGLHFMEFFQKHAPLSSTPAQTEALLRLCHDYDVKPI